MAGTLEETLAEEMMPKGMFAKENGEFLEIWSHEAIVKRQEG